MEILTIFLNETEPTNALGPEVIDSLVSQLNTPVNRSLPNGFLMALEPSIDNTSTVVGAVFLTQSNGTIVLTTDRTKAINSNISVGGIYNYVSDESIEFVQMVLIDSPSTYRNVTDARNRRLASSVVVANLVTNTMQPPLGTTISLYFRIKADFVTFPVENVDFYCAFYDNITKNWNTAGCANPVYNALWDRHECSCDHLTSFAMIWLPKTSTLSVQDIISLVAQFVSIFCFLIIIIHTLYYRLAQPEMGLEARGFLSLISNAVTMLLFIFYIALVLTVFRSSESNKTIACFGSATVLMLLVYFFLILTFLLKTSIAYFNYINFVRLFPPPSSRTLCNLFVASFLISITYVSFAAGFNSNSSIEITRLHSRKICWFTRRVIHYFVTIPICICLATNIFIFVYVAKRLINHARNSTSRHVSYQRMKRCVLILIASCVTQGLGWICGPFILFVNEETGEVFAWFFVVCNAFEGIWTILLYIVLLRIQIEEKMNRIPASQLSNKKQLKDESLQDDGQHGERMKSEKRILTKNERRISRLFLDLNDPSTADLSSYETGV